MEKYLKLIVEQLEKQEDKLKDINISNTSYEQNLFQQKEDMLNQYHVYNKYFNAFVKQSKNNIEKLDENKNKIDELLNEFPVKYQTTIHFDKNSRNQFLFTFFCLVLIVSSSIIVIKRYKDNTDYKKAWNFVMEQDLPVETRIHFNMVLENSKK
ncbi:hypothetical protein [Olleya sp. R77988]|uniref:hypothetical protein n=1 Tax=Olleya sp. R77988 TaxID=3093875 RepID=UPI0037C60941